jgi:hypothetical protein
MKAIIVSQKTVIARLDRAIQYAAAVMPLLAAGDYWMPVFAGMTRETSRGQQ